MQKYMHFIISRMLSSSGHGVCITQATDSSMLSVSKLNGVKRWQCLTIGRWFLHLTLWMRGHCTDVQVQPLECLRDSKSCLLSGGVCSYKLAWLPHIDTRWLFPSWPMEEFSWQDPFLFMVSVWVCVSFPAPAPTPPPPPQTDLFVFWAEQMRLQARCPAPL